MMPQVSQARERLVVGAIGCVRAESPKFGELEEEILTRSAEMKMGFSGPDTLSYSVIAKERSEIVRLAAEKTWKQ